MLRIDLDLASRRLSGALLLAVALAGLGMVGWRGAALWTTYRALEHQRAELARLENELAIRTRELLARERGQTSPQTIEHPLHAYPWADVIRSVPRFSAIDGVRLLNFEHSVSERRSRYSLELKGDQPLAKLYELVGAESSAPVRIVEQHVTDANGEKKIQMLLEADFKP